jgi:hypothetical protein
MPVEQVDPEMSNDLDPDAQNRGGPEAVRRLQAQLEELAEYVRLYLAARGDAIWTSVRMSALWLVVGTVGLVALVALVASAAAILMVGIAELVGDGLGRAWAGYAVTGFGFLALCAAGLVAAVIVLRRRFRQKTLKKYARRHEEQRRRFGHDAAGQAAAQRAERS